MSKQLEDIRKKIDSIDNKVHDLLMERAELVFDVAKAKKKNKLQIVHPAREANMIRRLLSRHSGPLPEATVVHIWRELVGAVSLLQTGLNVVVTAGENGISPYWDMARNYFGSVLPMSKVSSPLAAVAAVRDDDASFAVLPWPEDFDANPWWNYILHGTGDDKISIVCHLPYCYEGSPAVRSLIISKVDFKSSGDDYSFVALEFEESISRARVVEALKGLDLETLSVHTKTGGEDQDCFHLIELHDYIVPGDEVLQTIQDAFDGRCVRCVAVGGYPAMPEIKETIMKKESPAAPEKAPKAAKK